MSNKDKIVHDTVIVSFSVRIGCTTNKGVDVLSKEELAEVIEYAFDAITSGDTKPKMINRNYFEALNNAGMNSKIFLVVERLIEIPTS